MTNTNTIRILLDAGGNVPDEYRLKQLFDLVKREPASVQSTIFNTIAKQIKEADALVKNQVIIAWIDSLNNQGVRSRDNRS